MNFVDEINQLCKNNLDKRYALFADMDGVLAKLEIDTKNSIANNTKDYFLNVKPIPSVIQKLAEINKNPNLDLYILSACGYEEQAQDKRTWLEQHAPFFESDKQIYIIKDVVKYTYSNKADIKTQSIVDKLCQRGGYDYAIYLEDEYLMLKEANKKLKEKLIGYHISYLID